jgi:ribosomal protein S18
MFISERGKIRSRRVTGLTVQQQRQVAIAIKNSREMALLPYTPGGSCTTTDSTRTVPAVRLQ